ncbi:uncharacterized protein JCM10292_007067 [Rhodotorula paludigena]|uniref:uncharacterized protein n=1 Tax=Rhodotorula paludigena TaxID=86838 RepID=UPI003181D046
MLHLAYKPPSSAPSLAHWQARQARRFLLSFGGKSEPNSPKSGKGPHNGFKLRQLIASTLLQRKTTLNSSDADVALRFFSPQSSRADIAALHLDMAQSTFCLQPPGDSPTRKGFFDSILLGCIPVIFRRDTYSRIPLRRYTGQPVNVEDEVAYFLDADSLIGNVTILSCALLIILSLYAFRSSATSTQLFLITPTKDTITRYPHLLVFAQLLIASPSASSLTWIVVEDANEPDTAVAALLAETGLKHHYIAVPTRATGVHRGVEQRNAALDFLAKEGYEGVVYFADDDNAYRPALWSLLRRVERDTFLILPVGNTGYMGWEGPVVSAVSPAAATAAESKDRFAIQQWCCDYCVRRWNVDMSGFAFHTSLLEGDREQRAARFDLETDSGFLESDILDILDGRKRSSLVLDAELLRRIHVWHNFGKPFHRAGLYDADWTTEASLALRLANETDVARGFSWAARDLPRARMLAD